MTSIFLSYARSDDETFVRRLYDDLTTAGFDVWFDRVSMPSRQLTFHQEIRDAIAARERLLLVVGPGVLTSDYVTQEWRFAYFEAGKCVNPIVRLNGHQPNADAAIIDGFALIPEDLKLLHAEDFRLDANYDAHLANLIRQLSEAIPPVGKLVAVPELPACFLAQPDRIKALRDLLLVDLRKPVVVSGVAARVGLQGMGGIGKSVLASALAHRPEVRRAFPDGIFWITLGQKPQVADLQRWLARELGDEALFPDERSGKECLRALLAGRKALMVLDDVWQREHAEAFNVIGAMGRILLTTRDAGLVTALASRETHYRVELPTEVEAETIFASAAQLDPQALPAAAREIVRQCGRLPLALALCGGMVQGGVSPADVLAALREHDLEFLSDPHSAEEQHQNAWKAMDVSIRVLPPEQRDRFAELAVFALDRGAPEPAVATLWEHTAQLSPRNARKLLAEFAARSLVQLTPPMESTGQTGATMTLHDLLHNFAEGMAQKLFGSPAALHQTLLDAYSQKCPNGWPSGPNDGYFFENLCEHLVAAARPRRELNSLLFDFEWLEAKMNATSIDKAITDFALVSNSAPHRLLLSALRLSRNVVQHQPELLAGQLRGRLLGSGRTTIDRFVASIHPSRKIPWVNPVWPCLSTPDGLLVKTLEGHDGPVRCVAITPDGAFVVSGSGSVLKVWDLASGLEVRSMEAEQGDLTSIAITPDGQFAIAAAGPALTMWELATGRHVRTFQGHTDRVNCLAIAPDGRLAVSGSTDQTIKLWDLTTGNMTRSIDAHPSGVAGIGITPDGCSAVSASHDLSLKVWDLASGREIRSMDQSRSWLTCLAMSADGRFAISGSHDAQVRVWELATGKFVRSMGRHVTMVGKPSEAWNLTCVGITPDGRFAVSGDQDNILKVWDLATGKEMQSMEAHGDYITCLAITPDGQFVVSGSRDRTLKVWKLEPGRKPRVLPGHVDKITCVAITPDKQFAISGPGGDMDTSKALKVWNLATGEMVRLLDGHVHYVSCVAISPDGQFAVSGSWDCSVKVWHLPTGRRIWSLMGHEGTVHCVAITPDEKFIVSGGAQTKVWELETGQEVQGKEAEKESSRCVAITPDGKFAVSGTWNRKLRLWELPSGIEKWSVTGDSLRPICVAITPDARFVVSGFEFGTVGIWELLTGKEVRIIRAHSNNVNAIATTPDSQYAVSVSDDNSLKVWSLNDGSMVASFSFEDTVGAVGVSLDGNTAVVGAGKTLVRLELEALPSSAALKSSAKKSPSPKPRHKA